MSSCIATIDLFNCFKSKELAEEDIAVKVTHGFKHYGRKRNRVDCLVDYNMTVQKGTIYALLGPSGTGKTTLLSCLVGRKTLNRGEVLVFGKIPGTKGLGVPGRRVGYMPQDLALYLDFTLADLMKYFGWISGLNKEEIKERSDFLVDLLNLPTQNRTVKKLSGGQKRRVSFAVALLHDPELLILDEPTVGVDPLLRKSIWNHLVHLTTSSRKTIIITTHYIEEARQAHMIGLMRYGTILAEAPPERLLRIYRKSTLEEVFLALSSAQAERDKRQSVVEEDFQTSRHMRRQRRKATIFTKKSVDYIGASNKTYKMRALIFKNFLRMWRNTGVILFLIALPIVQVVLFSVAIGGEPDDLKVAIVNKEPYNKAATNASCQTINLSYRFLSTFGGTTIKKVAYSDLNVAKQAVRDGEVWGVIYFPKTYSDSITEAFAGFIAGQPSKELIENSQIFVWLDLSNQQIGFMLQRDISEVFKKNVVKLLKECKYEESLSSGFLTFQPPIYGANNPNFRDFVAPGVILTIIFFLGVAHTSISLITEKNEGMLDRTLVSGVSPTEILISHVIVQVLILVCQSGIVLLFILYIFKVKCEGSLVHVIIIPILQGICGMCYGYAISAACDQEVTAVQFALGSFYPCILLSGIMWPLEGITRILRIISQLSPLTLAVSALRAVMSRGWGILYWTVYMGYVATFVWIVFFLMASIIILHLRQG